MSYAPTYFGNQCIHCGDTKGNCRVHRIHEMHLCVALANSKKGERSQGYIVIGDTNDGRWAQLLPEQEPSTSNEKIEEMRRDWQRLEEEAKLSRLAGEMPARKRDKLYKEILSHLVLAAEDRADLERRGFSPEQITKCGFKSVTKWQKLSKAYPGNLPGINSQGKNLLSKEPGYACPIRDRDGLIVGIQVRKRILPDGDNQRYYWLSKDSNARLNDELPLAVFPGSSPGVGLVEGVGAKPFLACELLGISIVGAAGGNWAASKGHLKDSLESLGVKPGDVITVCPDAGSVSNAGVVAQYLRATKALLQWGHVVNFAWWGQSEKKSRDIDELKPEELARITYLSPEEFEALCIKWGGLAAPERSKVTPIDYNERVAAAQKRLHSLTYAADLICDRTKKYLPNLVGLIPEKGFVIIKAQKGSGKSHQIKLIKDYHCGYWEEREIIPIDIPLEPKQLELLAQRNTSKPEVIIELPKKERVFNKGRGMKFISVNARIALGREQAVRWEFVWIEDADISGKQEFEGAKLSTLSIVENIDEVGLCWDSLGKIFNRDWSNTVVVIDETELGLNHVSTSSTCRDRRSFILHTLEHKLKECLDNNGLVIAADADFSDNSLDYLTAIAPGHTPFIVTHDFKGEPWDIIFRTGKRDATLAEIDEWLSDENCRPIVVATDNQHEAEALALMLPKKYPWLAREKGGLIRIDSKVTQTEFGKNFVQHINRCIEQYLPKVLIYTPSLGVGCSIDIPYFAHVFGLFFGNIEPSQARQAVARPRQPIPRTIWAKDKVSNSENEPTSFLPEEIKRRLFDYHDTSMTVFLDAMTQARQLAIDSGIENPEDKDILPKLIETLQAMMGADGSWNNPHLDLYCGQIARRNYASSQYAVQLAQELQDEGHKITYDFTGDAESMGDEVKAVKAEIKEMSATAIAKAEFITFEEAQELKHKPVRTEQEEHQIAKAFLQQDLPGVELTPEFVHKAKYKDDGRWLAQVKLHWYTQNPEALKDRDEKEWRYKLNQFSKGVAFLPDVKTYTPRVEAILKSGVLDWVKQDDFEAEYSNESEEGKEFVKRCYKCRKIIKSALNISVTLKDEPVKLANKILERIGLRVTYSRQVRQDGNPVRYYKLDEKLANDEDLKTSFQALSLRWERSKVTSPESHAQHEETLSQKTCKSLYKNKSSVTENEPGKMPLADVLQKVTFSQEETINDNASCPAPMEENEFIYPAEIKPGFNQDEWVRIRLAGSEHDGQMAYVSGLSQLGNVEHVEVSYYGSGKCRRVSLPLRDAEAAFVKTGHG